MKQRSMKDNYPYLWPVGKGGLINPNRLVAAGQYNTRPIQRDAQRARREHRLIDLTFGEPCTWVLFMDSGHVIMTANAMPVAMLPPDMDYDPRLNE